ncbi:sushi, von Willebrand factor type A, EGF and pentraxin domain-containing protein 1 isoform X2 [Patella vulgata]|uniref:sushi, von Willebrand factor type A, EGF and pentraxin domain-containing protein 1 isoform X2 n=1 Tax=Patella vulgata TaxID=6465 RepID=UPI0024A9BFD3|nr:sushi, von Willebrand factor type A, EGF and pentraxin domain-containing protein 1 isoform X2 [Patella vulgata]
MVNTVLPCCLLLLALSGGNAVNYILDISVKCGTTKVNNPVVNILTDVAISARARCYGGDQTFTTTDKVHYTLPGTLTSAKKTCRWHQRTGSYTYSVDVLVRYGEVGSLILTKDKITTVVCTYDQYGKHASPQHNVLDNFIAPRELGTIIGSTVPSSQLKLSIQDVHNDDVKGDMNIDRKYTIYGIYNGPSKGVGLKPVHCDAVSSSGKRYAILRAGCGDGLVFRKQDGFITSGKTFRSPYFEGYHLDDSKSLSVECNVTLCTNCGGSSCDTVCNGPPVFAIINGKRGTCVGGYKYKSVCTFICNPGFNKLFTGVSACGPDGMWTVPKITCTAKNCGTPPLIGNGARTAVRTYFPNAAAYRCNAGYNMIGSGVVRCLSTGLWSARPTCAAKNCGRPPLIGNGAFTAVRTYFPNAATYRCNAGYNMRGSGVVRCLSTGRWAARPTCVAKDCGKPPLIGNGAFTAVRTYFPNAAAYRCNAGYTMVGSGVVRCLSTGRWAARPTCAANCGTPPNIANGARSAVRTYFPNAATYRCNAGYNMRGSGVVRCLSTRRWAPIPVCVAKNCGKPPLIGNGAFTAVRTYFPNAAAYRCNAGYTMVGSGVVRCLSTGRWAARPTCAANCGTPPYIANGARTVVRTYFPNAATYRCNVGYNMRGSGAVRCLSTRQWAPRPTCVIKNCGIPPNMRNGIKRYTKTTYGSTVVYGCNYAFRIVGNRNVACLSTGKWGRLPTCGRILCGTPPAIANGNRTFTLTYFPNFAIYKCNIGYAMTGSARVQCLLTNKWSTRPTCTITDKRCRTPTMQGAARIVRITGNREGDTIQLGCNNGRKPVFPKTFPTGVLVCKNGSFPPLRFTC